MPTSFAPSFFSRLFSVTNSGIISGTICCICTVLSGAAHATTPGVAHSPVATSGTVNVYVAGDIADCRVKKAAQSGAASTAALIAPLLQQDKDARVLTLGDNTYPIGAPAEFSDCYEPTWGQFRARTHPAPGNHDYATPQAQGYFEYFGASAGPQQRGYYRLQIGNWQVYSLNSNLKPDAQQEQLAWLKNELASHPARCTLAYWHHPLYSSGGHGNSPRMQAAWDLLYAANADLVLSGHDHDYERFAAQDGSGRFDAERGIVQFVVGTGGVALSPLLQRRPNSKSGQNTQHGVLKLVLKDGSFDWQYLAVGGGQFHDSGSHACH